MRVLHLSLSNVIFLFFLVATGWGKETVELDPLYNHGLFLIEKEMIKSKASAVQKPESYQSLLFLEDYFVNGGMSEKAMKVLHQIVQMRDVSPDLKKKAFLECEAWRAMDHDLKNNENKVLVQKLKMKRKFSDGSHVNFRKIVSEKVFSCLDYIGKDWVWLGPDYQEAQYDVKAKNAVESVRAYLLLKEKKN